MQNVMHAIKNNQQKHQDKKQDIHHEHSIKTTLLILYRTVNNFHVICVKST